MKRICCAAVMAAAVLFLLHAFPCRASAGKILIVFSGVDYISMKEGVVHQAGFSLPETAHILKALFSAGYEIECTTPGGARAVAERISAGRKLFKTNEDYLDARKMLSNPYLCSAEDIKSYMEADLRGFDGILVPGGHAVLGDLYRNKRLGYILNCFHKSGRPTGLISQGPLALLSAQQQTEWTYRGYAMTVISDDEEKELEKSGSLGGHIPLYPAGALAEAGGNLTFAPALWQSHVVKDRELITAQNAASVDEFMKVFLEALAAQKSKKR